MAFQLPHMEDLTTTQKSVLNAPLNKSIVVRGAPGTGKSVLAVYRAADFAMRGKSVLFLVFNKPLETYIKSAVRSLDVLVEVKTYHAWLKDFFIYNFHKEPPYVASTDDYQDFDYKAVVDVFKSQDTYYDFIILDEAQDFPLDFIQALSYVGKTINCFIDDNQRIRCNQRTRYAEIYNLLEDSRVYTLQDNFRNSEEIYKFADIYSHHTESILTRKNGEKPLFASINNDNERFNLLKRLILNNSTGTIGIITNAGEQESFQKRLTSLLEDKVPVKAYDGNSKNKKLWGIDFDQSGVYILSTGTAKGLEFDVVIIPTVDKLRSKRDANLDSNIFYVAATRASNELYCLYNEKKSSPRFIDVFGPLGQHEDLVDWE